MEHDILSKEEVAYTPFRKCRPLCWWLHQLWGLGLRYLWSSLVYIERMREHETLQYHRYCRDSIFFIFINLHNDSSSSQGSTLLHRMIEAMKWVIALIDYTLWGGSFIHKDMGVRKTYTKKQTSCWMYRSFAYDACPPFSFKAHVPSKSIFLPFYSREDIHTRTQTCNIPTHMHDTCHLCAMSFWHRCQGIWHGLWKDDTKCCI